MNAVPIRFAAVCLAAASALTARAGDAFDEDPIQYSATTPDDPIARLQRDIDTGKVTLEFDEKFGYLKAVLKALDIAADSQMLVFSKTSFQRSQISPQTPRALYFNDDVYIGYVQRGKVLEISSTDPQLGAVFYTLRQRRDDKPTFQRQTGECLQCHASSLTRNVPGHVVRSVHADTEGQPILRFGSDLVDHTTPLSDRWGGWYVTGEHGGQAHRGNRTLVDDEDESSRPLTDAKVVGNVTDLSRLIDASPYLAAHSDIAAMMVHEHQTRLHNLITAANYATRRALKEQAILNRMSGDPEDKPLDFVERRLAYTGEPLLKYMLFIEEAPLAEPVRGVSGFAERFSARGPRDAKGRSLHQLDLTRRLFRHPCSYLIYSESFDALPPRMTQYLYRRLGEILTGRDASEEYQSLSIEDRRAVYEILAETKPALAAFWREQGYELR